MTLFSLEVQISWSLGHVTRPVCLGLCLARVNKRQLRGFAEGWERKERFRM